jgi:hypothetical protein
MMLLNIFSKFRVTSICLSVFEFEILWAPLRNIVRSSLDGFFLLLLLAWLHLLLVVVAATTLRDCKKIYVI